jgi:Tfp pilus assembly protein PilX
MVRSKPGSTLIIFFCPANFVRTWYCIFVTCLLVSTSVHSSSRLQSAYRVILLQLPLNSWIASSPAFKALVLGTHHSVVSAGGTKESSETAQNAITQSVSSWKRKSIESQVSSTTTNQHYQETQEEENSTRADGRIYHHA